MTYLQMIHSLKWPIHSYDPFANDPFTQMTHSQMTHSLKWLINTYHPFANDPFTHMTHLQMTYSLEWPIHLNEPFVRRGEMSFYLSYQNNTIWSYEASDVINKPP